MNAPSLTVSRRHHHADDGFTLIELLLVIVILGVLSAIVVFSAKGITDKGDTAACKSDVATVTTAEEAFYAGSYGGTPLVQNGASTATYASIADLVSAGLLHAAPSSTKYTVTANATTGVVNGSIC